MKMKLTICLFIVLGLVALSFAQDVSVPNNIPEGMDTLELVDKLSEPGAVKEVDGGQGIQIAKVVDPTGITKVSKHGVAVFPTVAVCDIQKAFDGYKKAEALTKILDADTQKARQIVRQITKQIAIKQAELDKLKKRSDAYEKAFEELATMKAEHRVYVKTETAKLNERRSVLANSGLDDVRAAVAEVAKLGGLNLVLSQTGNRSSVIFADDGLDITDAVIAELNKKETK